MRADSVLALVPTRDEVTRRDRDRSAQLRKGTHVCRYVETAWQRYIVSWCP
jgi:hypothetical protein